MRVQSFSLLHSLIELLACGIGHVVLFVVVCCWLRVIVICCLLCVVVYVLFVVYYSLVDLIVFVELRIVWYSLYIL